MHQSADIVLMSVAWGPTGNALGLGLLQDREVEDGIFKREWKSLLSASTLDNGC
jgi:hypothetical protein